MTSATATKQLGTTLLERIGNTPLVRLDKLTTHLPGIRIYGKAEWLNPGGSVKDRAASNIVKTAIAEGKLEPNSSRKILLDATSGNTGIAYAMLGAALGFPVTLCVPENVSLERKRILQAYGANILYTDPGEGSDGAIKIAQQLAERHPDLYYYADQYSNEANWRAHYETTANESVLSAKLRNCKIVFPAVSDSPQLYAESERGMVRSKVSR
jgi:cysteine synthase B